MSQPTTKTQQVVPLEPKLSTGGKLQPIVPQSWNEAVQMAGAFVRSGMVPKHFEGSVEKATVAIIAGLEVGMTPMTALQSIAVINNSPTIYGDGMLGLVRASGFLEDIEEGVEWEKDQPVAATCRVKRKGEKTWGTHTFTMSDAMKGGLLGKPGPWKQYPQRMLQMRARAWALRDKFADVLRGLRSAEEMEDMVDVTPQGSADTPPPPQRNDPKYQQPSDGGSPHTDQSEVGQAGAHGSTADGGKPAIDSGPSAQPDPKETKPKRKKGDVTDVQDQNEAAAEDVGVTFEKFTSYAKFYDWSDTFLQSAATTEAQARAWRTHYTKEIDARLAHENPTARAEMNDTLSLYLKKVGVAPDPAKEREPGQER